MESLIIAFISTMFVVGGTSGTFGPHQEPAPRETVAVVGASGETLYLNYK
jgi:hypothetical protein